MASKPTHSSDRTASVKDNLHAINALQAQTPPPVSLSEQAERHLWLDFTRMGSFNADNPLAIITRAEGIHVFDDQGRRYLDGISSLFTTQVGHAHPKLVAAYGAQAAELDYFPLWGYAHPRAIELAARLASLAPGDLNRVFFTTGGAEANESAWKLVRQYFKLTGRPHKTKVISRQVAYHGTAMGSLAMTALPGYQAPFLPIVPGGLHIPNTNFYRAPVHHDDPVAFGRWAADQIEQAILAEGPDTVAMVIMEPVQNAGGCFVPPPGYFERVREICDTYDVMLVADEVITSFGRLGEWFASTRYGLVPDIITCAKGMTSAYAPIGAMIASDRLFEPFSRGQTTFLHGYTFAGHPIAAAVALANLEVLASENLFEAVRSNQEYFRARLETLYELPIVGDVRGDGYFFAVELVKDQETKETFTEEESERLLRGYLSKALFEAGLICRSDDRGDPVVQLAPPLITTRDQLDEMVDILADVLAKGLDVLSGQ
jgi:adenosylmethionine-8-amino-7-oxononanoate aminotransferase